MKWEMKNKRKAKTDVVEGWSEVILKFVPVCWVTSVSVLLFLRNKSGSLNEERKEEKKEEKKRKEKKRKSNSDSIVIE